jgi:hypothetical protein
MSWLQSIIRCAVYLILLLLGVSWAARGLASAQLPLLDLGSAGTGGLIIATGGVLGLSPEGIFRLARFLTGAKLLLAGYLLAAAFYSLHSWLTREDPDDAMLEAILPVAAVITLIAAAAALIANPASLPALSAELLLCALASALAAVSRPAGQPPQLTRTDTASVSPMTGPFG